MVSWTSLSFLPVLPKISAHRMNKYGERGQLCLMSRLNVKNSEAQPLFWMQLLIEVLLHMHNLRRLISCDALHCRKPCRIRLGGRRFQGFYFIPFHLHIHFVPVHLESRFLLERCSRTYYQLVDYRKNRVVGRRIPPLSIFHCLS